MKKLANINNRITEDLDNGVKLEREDLLNSSVGLIVGPMGIGKTNLMFGIVDELKAYKQIIHDPKEEYAGVFYDEKEDILLHSADKRSARWDILADVADNRRLWRLVFEHILIAIYADVKPENEKMRKAADWSWERIVPIAKAKKEGLSTKDLIEELIQVRNEAFFMSPYPAYVNPIMSVLEDLYHKATKLVGIGEILASRRVFLGVHKKFEWSGFVNNALLALVVDTLAFSGRGTHALFLDEYQSFRLNETSKGLLLSLNEKVFLATQRRPLPNLFSDLKIFFRMEKGSKVEKPKTDAEIARDFLPDFAASVQLGVDKDSAVKYIRPPAFSGK